MPTVQSHCHKDQVCERSGEKNSAATRFSRFHRRKRTYWSSHKEKVSSIWPAGFFCSRCSSSLLFPICCQNGCFLPRFLWPQTEKWTKQKGPCIPWSHTRQLLQESAETRRCSIAFYEELMKGFQEGFITLVVERRGLGCRSGLLFGSWPVRFINCCSIPGNVSWQSDSLCEMHTDPFPAVVYVPDFKDRSTESDKQVNVMGGKTMYRLLIKVRNKDKWNGLTPLGKLIEAVKIRSSLCGEQRQTPCNQKAWRFAAGDSALYCCWQLFGSVVDPKVSDNCPCPCHKEKTFIAVFWTVPGCVPCLSCYSKHSGCLKKCFLARVHPRLRVENETSGV